MLTPGQGAGQRRDGGPFRGALRRRGRRGVRGRARLREARQGLSGALRTARTKRRVPLSTAFSRHPGSRPGRHWNGRARIRTGNFHLVRVALWPVELRAQKDKRISLRALQEQIKTRETVADRGCALPGVVVGSLGGPSMRRWAGGWSGRE